MFIAVRLKYFTSPNNNKTNHNVNHPVYCQHFRQPLAAHPHPISRNGPAVLCAADIRFK